MKNQPADLHDIVPVGFYQSQIVTLPVRGLAPGIHSIQIREGSRGSSLPRVNEQRIEFLVE